jgi:hypothetical protein
MSMLREAHVDGAKLAQALLAAVLVGGVMTIVLCLAQPFVACAVRPFDDNQKLALNVLADMVKLLLTLSTVLIAFGGTVLLGLTAMLGLKEASQLTLARRILMLASTCCFVFSACFALLWHIRLAQAYYVGCPGLISQQLEAPFNGQLSFFALGLALIASVVLLVTFGQPSCTSVQTENIEQ